MTEPALGPDLSEWSEPGLSAILAIIANEIAGCNQPI